MASQYFSAPPSVSARSSSRNLTCCRLRFLEELADVEAELAVNRLIFFGIMVS